MRHATLASLRARLRQFGAAGVAVVLGVAFVAAILTVADSAQRSVRESVGAPYATADVVVRGVPEPDLDHALDTVAGIDGVAGRAGLWSGPLEVVWPGASAGRTSEVQALPADAELRWQRTERGRLPSAAGEVAVSGAEARARDVTVGERLTVTDVDGTDHAATVTGILGDDEVMADAAQVVAPAPIVRAWLGETILPEILVRAQPRIDAETLRDRVDAAVATADVMTADERIDQEVRSMTRNIDVFGVFFLTCAGVALFVAALVIANTFTILLARRTRELALLRCVGASRRQILGSVLLEAAAMGAVASAVGVVVGLATGAGAAVALGRLSVLDIAAMSVSVPVTAVVVPFGLGVVVTVVAALAPARRATRVSPLAALRPVPTAPVRSRVGVLRSLAGAVLLLSGAGLLALAAGQGDVVPGLAGGAVSFVGILLFSPFLVPAAVRGLGALTGRAAGVPGRLAVANAVRNPGRTATVCSALLVGVTLLSMLVVGESSMRRSVERTVDAELSLDLGVRTAGDVRIPHEMVEEVRAVDGVERVLALRVAEATVVGQGSSAPIAGVDPAQAAEVLRDPAEIAHLRDGVAAVPMSVLEALGVQAGSRIRLRVGEGMLAVRAEPSAEGYGATLLTTADLARLAPDAVLGRLWIRASDGVDATHLVADVEAAVDDLGDSAWVSGSLPRRQSYDDILTMMLALSVALLAVAAVIAVIGVGNALSLSTIERSHENALLRALGLTRRQLGRLLAAEALLVSVVAAVVGTALGVGYGWLGTTAILGAATDEVAYVLPLGRLLLIAGLTLVAALLACVFPARQALRVPPAAALAVE